MSIIILGAGSIGSYLATSLSNEGHNVIVIDHASKPLERLAENADVATRLGSGTDWQLLEELLEHDPFLFIAVSSDDETNLVACSLAKNLGYPKTVARIRHASYLNRSRLDFPRLFFVDHLIGSELIVAHDIVKHVLHSHAVAVENFAHGSVQMRTLVLPSTWQHAHKKISELELPPNLLIGLIYRRKPAGEQVIFPTGFDPLLPNDEITLIGESKIMSKLPETFGLHEKRMRSVMIIGSSSIAVMIGKLLDEQGVAVKVIDNDEESCRKMAEELPKATILCHEPTDVNFLLAEKMDEAEGVICVTSPLETNVLIAALAKQIGCQKVVPLVSEESYLPFLRHLGITTTASERTSIANRIRALTQSSPLFSISSLYEDRAKIMEVKISTDSQIVGIPISDLKKHLPKDLLFALIENRGAVTIPKGNHILAPGDSVIVICHPKHLPDLEKIL